MDKKNIKLTVLATAVCRTPAFSTSDGLEACWPALKELIREASPAFFEIIGDLSIEQLGEKARYTVWKYFNRARFRSTPFGSFAAVSFVPVVSGGAPLLLQSGMVKRNFADWSEKDKVSDSAPPKVFIANATCYTVAGEVRYLRHLGGQFELASIRSFPELQAVLSACQQPATEDSVCDLLAVELKLAHASSRALLRQLAGAQLLLTDRNPNITGPDYFERLHFKAFRGPADYVIAERQVLGGALDAGTVDDVPEYLNFINGFLPVPQQAHLDTFKQAFQRKFDNKAVPLALAMDPQTGVGYGNMAQDPRGDEFGELLEDLQQQKQGAAMMASTPQIQFLLNGLLKGDTIRLENYAGQAPAELPALPNTFSVVFHCSRGQAVLEQAGGCTANALLGRFTLDSPEATREGKAIAEFEELANPDVLFFDVAYQAEKQVDNVNRRAALYRTELPVLTWSCHPSPLLLNDILVAVRNGEIVLWSKKHKQRIVPRIASAYNYTRSDLALFRFLCDLQHQGLRTDLSFRLQHFFPGLARYPRVNYKNVVVSPASWLVDKMYTKDLASFRDWLHLQQITFPFQCGSTDQTLLIDPANNADLEAFILYAKQSKELYITEALQDREGVKDENGKTYTAQYIAGFGHGQRVYAQCVPLQESSAGGVFFPGDEWLYIELYGHATRSNQLLTDIIRPFLADHKKQLKQWFFIRYTDGGPHIRLRLRLHEPAAAILLLGDLKAQLAPLYNQGLLWDMQVKTYFPESERYGAERMELVEEFFALDSAYTLKSLAAGDETGLLYLNTLMLMERLCSLAFPDVANRLSFVQTVADSFGKEFGFGMDDYKKINRSFENLKKDTFPLMLNKVYLGVFGRIISGCAEDQTKTRLLADLLHMHVNRVFYADQRLHEAILYQYLLKRTKSALFAGAHATELLSKP